MTDAADRILWESDEEALYRTARGQEDTLRAERAESGTRDAGKDLPVLRKHIVKYRTAHRRVRDERGPAREHECVDCGDQAQDWSYDNQDPNELIDLQLRCAYSLDTAHYQPRCKLCHSEYDLRYRLLRNPPPSRKACTKCGEVKPIEEFTKDGRRIDGRQARCQACDRVMVAARARRLKDRGEVRVRQTRAQLAAEIVRLNTIINELGGKS